MELVKEKDRKRKWETCKHLAKLNLKAWFCDAQLCLYYFYVVFTMNKGVVKHTVEGVKRSLVAGSVPDDSWMIKVRWRTNWGLVRGLTFSFDLMGNSDHCGLRNIWMFILTTEKHTVNRKFDFYTNIQKFVVSKIFLCFWKKSLMLTKAAFVWSKKCKTVNSDFKL